MAIYVAMVRQLELNATIVVVWVCGIVFFPPSQLTRSLKCVLLNALLYCMMLA